MKTKQQMQADVERLEREVAQLKKDLAKDEATALFIETLAKEFAEGRAEGWLTGENYGMRASYSYTGEKTSEFMFHSPTLGTIKVRATK